MSIRANNHSGRARVFGARLRLTIAMESKPLYYPVWIAPGRKAGGWSWGKPCDTPGEADQILKQQFLAEKATLGCVVKITDGAKRPLLSHARPTSARTIIEHWQNLLDATEPTT